MKKKDIALIAVITCLLSCSPSCTLENINLIGEWDVQTVEFVDEKNNMRNFLESQGINYDEYVASTKILEQTEFHFKEQNQLGVISPEEIGGNGESVYHYNQGESTIVIGDLTYDFTVTDCDAVTITSNALDNTTKLHMHCVRLP